PATSSASSPTATGNQGRAVGGLVLFPGGTTCSRRMCSRTWVTWFARCVSCSVSYSGSVLACTAGGGLDLGASFAALGLLGLVFMVPLPSVGSLNLPHQKLATFPQALAPPFDESVWRWR